MLSYRHAFHAGNHADILKHYVLSLALDYFNKKDKPYCVVDTHAGAGMYALNSDFSQKNKEFETGISRLLSTQAPTQSLANFFAMVQSFNAPKTLTLYPGSPKVAEYYLRAKDQLRLFELHPTDHAILESNFTNKGKQTKVEKKDGFIGLKSYLPPTTKRGLVIIDPPYEDKQDYQHVVNTIQDSLKRFQTGTYLVWYPLLQKPEPLQMTAALQKLQNNNWLNVTLQIEKPSKDGFGMFGSGLFIINPPWTLPKTLTESLPFLSELLAQDETAAHQLTFEMN